MQLHSTNNSNNKVNFEQAVLQGLASDGGVFMPDNLPLLQQDFLDNLHNLSFVEIATYVATQLLSGEVDEQYIKQSITDAYDFALPLVEVEQEVYALELFHGPTYAFKDFGARFMARMMAYFVKKSGKKVTILVATSGDTGSAVGNGFLGMDNIDVVLLYPKGMVSKIQEQQLTTMGQNITAIEINGVFDEAQAMVKKAFVDQELLGKINLSSANSINIARLLPQAFYYFYMYGQLQKLGKTDNLVVSVPSGNFGNLTAGLFAWKMGLPIKKFVTATNINDTIPRFLETGEYDPHPTKQTISNAMDVGQPNNFPRIMELFSGDREELKQMVVGYSFTDEQTEEALRRVYEKQKYIMDPHGAVAYLGVENYLEDYGSEDITGVFLETAHPAKFADVVEPIVDEEIALPLDLAAAMDKPKQAVSMGGDYEEFKEWLLGR